MLSNVADDGVCCRSGHCKEICHGHHAQGAAKCLEHPEHEDVQIVCAHVTTNHHFADGGGNKRAKQHVTQELAVGYTLCKTKTHTQVSRRK